MTNYEDMQKIMKQINDIILEGTAIGLSSRKKYENYKSLLPPEVVLVDFPSGNLNCAGYALDLGHTTGSPESYIESRYTEVDSPENAEIYVLYQGKDWIHLGKIIDKDTAISKWGWYDPIFRHPVYFYPARWDTIKYFKKDKERCCIK